MIGAPHPRDTHNTSSLYIVKVFDLLYMWLVVHMDAAKHYYSMLLGTMCHSFEHISVHYDMVEVGDHFRVDCTSILYV